MPASQPLPSALRTEKVRASASQPDAADSQKRRKAGAETQNTLLGQDSEGAKRREPDRMSVPFVDRAEERCDPASRPLGGVAPFSAVRV
eukprot:2436803-Rhodomonas_salina.1